MSADVVATRVQLLPDVIDVTFILTCSGGCALAFTLVGVSLRLHHERLARLVVLGNVIGAGIGASLFPHHWLGIL